MTISCFGRDECALIGRCRGEREWEKEVRFGRAAFHCAEDNKDVLPLGESALLVSYKLISVLSGY